MPQWVGPDGTPVSRLPRWDTGVPPAPRRDTGVLRGSRWGLGPNGATKLGFPNVWDDFLRKIPFENKMKRFFNDFDRAE